ncbi:MAG: ornithine cyclodeaminase family protein [Bdellovibrionales bacterium]
MEKVIIVDEKKIRSILPHVDLKGSIHRAFSGLADNSNVQPLTVVMDFPAGKGDCWVQTGSAPTIGICGATVTPFIPARKDHGLDPATAFSMLVSSETGELLMVCDSGYLVKVRTAATTAIAIDYLAPADAKTLAIIGLGPIGLEHLRLETARGTYENVRVFSPSPEKRKAAVSALAPNIIFCADIKSAVRGADVVILCTGATAPVLDIADIKTGALVVSTASDGAGCEIDPAALNDMDVYCDYIHSAPHKAHDFKSAEQQYNWRRERIIADLADLCSGRKQAVSSGKVRYWRSCGMGLQDLAACKAVYDVMQSS